MAKPSSKTFDSMLQEMNFVFQTLFIMFDVNKVGFDVFILS